MTRLILAVVMSASVVTACQVPGIPQPPNPTPSRVLNISQYLAATVSAPFLQDSWVSGDVDRADHIWNNGQTCSIHFAGGAILTRLAVGLRDSNPANNTMVPVGDVFYALVWNNSTTWTTLTGNWEVLRAARTLPANLSSNLGDHAFYSFRVAFLDLRSGNPVTTTLRGAAYQLPQGTSFAQGDTNVVAISAGPGHDTRTLAHETGHVFGLMDIDVNQYPTHDNYLMVSDGGGVYVPPADCNTAIANGSNRHYFR